MHQEPNLNQEIRDTAAQSALAEGNGGEVIERWREDYQQKRSQGKIA